MGSFLKHWSNVFLLILDQAATYENLIDEECCPVRRSVSGYMKGDNVDDALNSDALMQNYDFYASQITVTYRDVAEVLDIRLPIYSFNSSVLSSC